MSLGIGISSMVTTQSLLSSRKGNDISGAVEAMRNKPPGGLEPKPKGELRMWKEVYNYKGDDPEREGNRMVAGELKGKNGGDVSLEYNPEKVRSGEKVIGKDYNAQRGNPGLYSGNEKPVWFADHREMHGDTLEQIAAADSHGITGDAIDEKVNKDGSLKTGGGGSGQCCVFNNYGGGGCGACSHGAGPELIPELLLTLHQEHHTQHMATVETKNAAYTPVPKLPKDTMMTHEEFTTMQENNMTPQREAQVSDVIGKKFESRYVKMQIRDQYEKMVDEYVKEEIHNNSSSYNPTKEDVVHAANRAMDLGADTRTIVASQTQDLQSVATDTGLPFRVRNEAQDRINSIRGAVGKLDDMEKYKLGQDAKSGKLSFDNENYQVSREGGLASQHLKAMDEKAAALKDPEVQKDLAKAKGEATGQGQCCIHNEYGGGGCGPCNHSNAGPEIDEKYNFDNFFGKDKSPESGMQPYVDKNGRVFVRFWAIGPGVNRHEWGADTDYIANNMPTLPGKDITFMKQETEDGKVIYPHPAIKGATPEINEAFQKNWKIGTALDYERTPDKDGNWYGIGEITDHHAKEFFAELYTNNKTAGPSANLELPIYVSPQIIHYQNEPDHQKIKKFWFQHITLTDDPAYSPNIAKITESCVGDEAQCMTSLKHASMARLNMGCIKMALEQMLANNVVRTIKNASNHNTSLISKQASLNLDNSMTEPSSTNESKDTQNSNTNSNPLQPEFAQPQAIDPSKFNESIKEMIAKSLKEGNLTDREKILLEQVEQLNNSLKTEADKNSKLNEKITGIESRESRRNIELLLIPYEKAFKNEKGQFDEKKFNENVDYWLSKNAPIETVKKDIDMAMGYAMATIPEPRTDAYASSAGQSSQGQSMTDIYEAPTVGANLPDEKETKNASMSGNELVDPRTLYFIKQKGGRVI